VAGPPSKPYQTPTASPAHLHAIPADIQPPLRLVPLPLEVARALVLPHPHSRTTHATTTTSTLDVLLNGGAIRPAEWGAVALRASVGGHRACCGSVGAADDLPTVGG